MHCIPNIFRTEFTEQNPDLVPSGNALGFISDDGGNTYNRCHCKSACNVPSQPWILIIYHAVWSNFEIGDLDLWRGEAYSKFFDFLDQKGGFYYEVHHCSS